MAHFRYELRRDLIPAVESAFSTWTEGDVSEENLVKTRSHRAFAGLSLGSMTTYRAAFYNNFALFSPLIGLCVIGKLPDLSPLFIFRRHFGWHFINIFHSGTSFLPLGIPPCPGLRFPPRSLTIYSPSGSGAFPYHSSAKDSRLAFPCPL